MVDVNKISTVFGRENLHRYIRNEINNGNLVKKNKKSLQVSEPTGPIPGSYNKQALGISICNSEEVVKTVDSNNKNINYEITEDMSDEEAKRYIIGTKKEPLLYYRVEGSNCPIRCLKMALYIVYAKAVQKSSRN